MQDFPMVFLDIMGNLIRGKKNKYKVRPSEWTQTLFSSQKFVTCGFDSSVGGALHR